MDPAKVKSAEASVANARLALTKAFQAWDEAVSNMQLAWIAVRKAERHLQDADAILHHEITSNGGGS